MGVRPSLQRQNDTWRVVALRRREGLRPYWHVRMCTLVGLSTLHHAGASQRIDTGVGEGPSLLKAGSTGLPSGRGQQVVAWSFPPEKRGCGTQQLTGSISRLENTVFRSQHLIRNK